MEYLLANRIFMFFSYPLLCKLFCCVTGCVTSSGHMLRSHDTKSKDTPSGGMRYYYTVECFRVILFFDLLGEECFFLVRLLRGKHFQSVLLYTVLTSCEHFSCCSKSLRVINLLFTRTIRNIAAR